MSSWPRIAILRGDFQQPRLEVVFKAPPLEHLDGVALDLAAFALGSGEISRLSRRLRDEKQVVTSIGASVYTPKFGGVFEISAFMTPDQMGAAAEGIARELVQLRTREPVSDVELQRARANLKADRVAQEETVDGQARALGFGLRTAHGAYYDDVYMAQVNAMGPSVVDQAVKTWINLETATLVALVHNDHPLTEAELRDAFVRGAQPLPRQVTPGKAATGSEGIAATEVFKLSSGLTLIYRPNPHVDFFTVTAATEGGLRGETAATAGLGNGLAGMLATATEAHTYEELLGEIEGLGATLEGFSGKDSLGLHLQCLTEHAPRMLELFRECLLAPVFPEEQWVTLSRELVQALAAQNDSPSGIAIRRFQEQLYGEHPYRYPLIGTEASLQSLSPDVLSRAFREIRPSGPWVLAVASVKPAAEVVRMLETALAGFAPAAAPRRFASDRQVRKGAPGQFQVKKDREQTHIVYGFPGTTWDDPDRAALDVLVNVLGGHSGRLFRSLRDRDSLAYTVTPMISYGRHPGIIGSYIACAPDKAGRALAALKAEMLALTKAAPTPAEMERARRYIAGTHEMSLQKSDAQTSTMALMELYGYGYDDFLKYPKAVAAVREEQVLRVAQKLLVPERAVEVQVGPLC